MRNWKVFFLRITICLSILVGVIGGYEYYYQKYLRTAVSIAEALYLFVVGFVLGWWGVWILYAAVWICYGVVRWIYRGLYK